MSKISRLECLCAAGYFLLYLYIHGALMLRMGMNVDEMLDFGGSDTARQVYLAVGRWGIALWGKLVGAGYIPMAGGVTAGLILSVAYIGQCRLLNFLTLKDKALYGAISLACFQFASMQVYSMQVEGGALGLLLATFSCMVLLMSRCMSFGRLVTGTLLLFCSLSFYQTCGVFFVVLYGLALLSRGMQGEPLHLVKHGMVVITACVGALALFMATKMCILQSGAVGEDIAEFCRVHEESMLREHLFTANSPTLTGQIGQYVRGMWGKILCYNSYTALLWCLCAIVVPIRILMQRKGLQERLKQMGVYALTVGVPLLLYACFLKDVAHAWLFLPLLEGSICILALKEIRLSQWGIALLAGFLSLACIKAAHHVSRYAAGERAYFEEWDMVRKLQYIEAQRYAMSQGMDPRKTRILLVETVWNVRAPDFYAKYPLFPNFHMATWKDQEKHAVRLQQMPTWPAEGSIAESQGEIIIKGQ